VIEPTGGTGHRRVDSGISIVPRSAPSALNRMVTSSDAELRLIGGVICQRSKRAPRAPMSTWKRSASVLA